MRTQRATRPALTLIEVVIVVSLAAMVLGLLMPAVLSAQGAARQRLTVNCLKQIGLALHNHQDSNRTLPPAYGKLGKFETEAAIHVYLMPYLEEDNHFKQYMKEKGAEKVQSFKVPVFLSDLDSSRKNKEEGIQNYAANLRVFSDAGLKTAHDKNMDIDKKTSFDGHARIPASFPDGTSNTIVYATKYGICGEGGSRYASSPHSKFAAFFGQNAATEKASATSAKATFQLAPTDKECVCSPLMAQSFDKTGLITGIADGSVRILNVGLSAETWNRALCPNDGNVLGGDWDK